MGAAEETAGQARGLAPGRQLGRYEILARLASGGLNLGNIAAFARTGVARLSVGSLTHSAPYADVALEIEKHREGL